MITLGAAAVAGALLGVALAGTTMDTDLRTTLSVTGGGLAGAAIVVAIVWQPGEHLGLVYNRALARRLRLPAR